MKWECVPPIFIKNRGNPLEGHAEQTAMCPCRAARNLAMWKGSDLLHRHLCWITLVGSAEMVHISVSSHLSVLNFLSLKTKDLGTPIFHNEEVTWCWFYTSTKTQQATYVE